MSEANDLIAQDRKLEVLSWFLKARDPEHTDEAIKAADKCMKFINDGTIPKDQ